jgi:hypothetical protein
MWYPTRDSLSSVAPIVDVRAGQHACYDRLVVDIGGARGGSHVRYVPAVHTQARGDALRLRGGAFLEIIVLDPTNNVNTGAPTYRPANNNELVTAFRNSIILTVVSVTIIVITCAMVESPRLHFDDVSTEPQRLLIGIADAMTAPGSWNMWFRSNMVVAMSPQHAGLCADAGLGRADVHARLCELAVRRQGDLKRGGNWRPERAVAMGVDPEDDDFPIKAVKDPERLHLIVAGGMGPITAVCHGWNESSAPVHGIYEV